MSAKPAAIPLFGDAYLADTRHLTTEEHGAYLLLMMAAWRQDDCALPDDDRKLARITGLTARKWASIKPTIMEFWQVEKGRIFQGRLRKERAYVDQKSESNRKSAEARWSKQTTENKQSGECERISECNAPPPSPPQVSLGEEAKASPPQRAKRASAGTRMSADWVPGPLPPDVAALVALWPPGRFEREVAGTRDYWLTRTTKREKWDLTLHNRIRDIHDRVLRDCNNGRSTANWGFSAGGGRDNRDGFARALDRRLGFDETAGEAGRQDFGSGGGDSSGPVARLAAVR